jgi:organic hydroperoxide reductase OsmC/OhrA
MTDETRFTISLEHVRDYEFEVHFEQDGVPDLVLDEPEPLGNERGPNAARILAAAVGNCLAASLLFCLRKARVEARGIETRVRGTLVRNERGRLRIGRVEVRIDLDRPDEEGSRVERCLDLFQDYCLITESVRGGIPVDVQVRCVDARSIAG